LLIIINFKEINVKGLYLCTRTYLRALAGKPGVILNVSSSVSDMVTPNLSSYATTKTAVNRSVQCP
jgi:short-subunit dehydrogenase